MGWLCITRLNLERGAPMHMPASVRRALVVRGWLESDEEPDTDGLHSSLVTAAGDLAADLHSPEWGIDPIPVE